MPLPFPAVCPEPTALLALTSTASKGWVSGFPVLHSSTAMLQPSPAKLRLVSWDEVCWELWCYKRSQSRNWVVIILVLNVTVLQCCCSGADKGEVRARWLLPVTDLIWEKMVPGQNLKFRLGLWNLKRQNNCMYSFLWTTRIHHSDVAKC